MATISATPSATSGTITSTGLGSGLDINGLVSQLIAADSQPLNQLNAKETQYQAQLTAYGNVKSALSSFQSAVSGLTSANAFQAVAANSGDTSVYTASADNTAVAGSYDIEVVNLAKSQKLVSGPFNTVNDVVGTGVLTFQFGTDNAGVFTENGSRPSKTVTIDSAHSSLSGIRDAINAANIGVSATIINDGTGYKLSLTSSQTGAANSLKITVSGDGDDDSVDNAGLSQLAYDPAGTAGNGRNMTETVAAQDATLNVDGINGIKKPGNTITDLIQGVTLNLAKPSEAGVPSALTVGRDTTSALGLVQKFVDAYNDLHKTLSDVTAYDPDTQQGGLLLGDSTILALDRQLRSMITASVPGASGDYKLLSNIGVSFQKDGTLSVSATKLQAALDADPQGVASLFATVGRTSDSLISYSGATSATKPGSYAVNVTQLATQGSLKGTATAALANTDGTFSTPVVIDSGNDTLVLQVDGVQTGNISLSHGTYTTGAALAAALQSQINGDSALIEASAAVTVSFDDAAGALSITSNRYGSASNVSVVSAADGVVNDLGLAVGSGTAGVDVAGTINGVLASGSGQFLTGALGDASSGLKIQISGGALGARGKVSYSQGYADQLDAFVGIAIGSTGPIAARTDGINKSIADIKDQVTTLNARLATLQQQYLAQFNAMDALVAQMKSTSDFLTQQLAIVAANTSTGK
jgi:flagellar hook-associated protein 2